MQTATDERYIRNLGPLSEAECRTLSEKRVFVAGCGGLGGYAAELLGRLGVGKITLADGDSFSRSNLNRQLMSTEGSLGMPKAEAAKQRLNAVNPDVTVTVINRFLTRNNCQNLIAGHDLVIDALDNTTAKCMLEHCCELCGIPLIHGAVNGWNGQVSVVYPGDRLTQKLYAQKAPPPLTGTLSFSPAVIGGIQVSEAVKLLLERGKLLRGKLLLIDLLTMELRTVKMMPLGQ